MISRFIRMRHSFAAKSRQFGFSLIEILITLVVVSFGLLGLAGFVTKSTMLTADTTQRARAAALLSDMASRIASNKTIAASFVVGTTVTTVYGATVSDCAGKTLAALDLCQWNNLLLGSNDAQAGGNASALGYRGCITKPVVSDPNYVITVAWGSIAQGVPPADACAAGAFGDDTYRRVLRAQVRVATLS